MSENEQETYNTNNFISFWKERKILKKWSLSSCVNVKTAVDDKIEEESEGEVEKTYRSDETHPSWRRKQVLARALDDGTECFVFCRRRQILGLLFFLFFFLESLASWLFSSCGQASRKQEMETLPFNVVGWVNCARGQTSISVVMPFRYVVYSIHLFFSLLFIYRYYSPQVVVVVVRTESCRRFLLSVIK